MIKAIVFDLDDTLISEKEYIRSGFDVIAEKVSKDYSYDKNYIYSIMINLFKENSKNVFNRLLDVLNIVYKENYIMELINIYRKHTPNISLYKDAKEILDFLYSTELKLGIITDGYKITQRKKIEALDIEKSFDCIVVTDELGREYWKPNRKSYDIVKKQLEVEYSEIVYVGDNVNKDFITANKLGINTVFINRKDGVYSNIEKEDEYKAHYSINNLNELIHIINSNKVLGEI